MSKPLPLAIIVCSVAFAACSSDPATTPAPAGGGSGNDAAAPDVKVDTAGDAQTPPTGNFATIEAWLAKGDYKSWHCEPAAHPARDPSPHGINRICSNEKSSAHADGEYPVGAANVKELYDAAGTSIIGYAVELHTTAGKTGADWYWYERNPTVGAPAKDGSPGLVANDLGGAEKSIEQSVCVGCHGAAGSDAAHFGHDLVYTQVK